MMGSISLSSFGATYRRVAAAGHGMFSSGVIAMLLTSMLVVATSSCGGASSSIVGSTLQDVQSFQATAGNDQVGTAGSDLPTPITVRALAKGGQGVSGISVQWTFSGGGGSLTPGGTVSQSLTTVTDKQGKSSVYWQLDTIAGDQTATATLSGTSSNSTTSVKFHSHGKAGGPATLVVSPWADTLAVGDSVQFTATVLDRWKNVISGVAVSWSSTNDSVVTVSSTGMAKALRSGSATIVATTSPSSTSAAGSSSISGGASVSVESSTASATNPPGTVSDLKASSATDSSVTLTWTQVNDGTGNPAKYALRYGTPTMSWSADYGTEVSVNGTSIGATESYTFKGLQAGRTYQFQLVSYRGTLNVDAVFGSLSNIASGSTTGSGALQAPTITVTPASLSFTSIGATAQLSAVAKDSTGNTVSNPGFTWQSLATSVATVSSSGLVTAKAVGTTAIIVTAACCASKSVPVGVDTATTTSPLSPQAPAVGSPNIVIDTRAGGAQSIQASGVTTTSTALSAMGAKINNNASNNNPIYPLDFVTNFDGSGTHAYRFNWTYLGGYTGTAATCDNANGEENKMVYFNRSLPPTPLYIQWKIWYGRTASGGGYGNSTVGSFNHAGPAGGHKIMIMYRQSDGGTKYRVYFGYNGSTNGLVWAFNSGWGDISITGQKSQAQMGLTPTNLNDYDNQVVTWTLYIKPESAASAYDGELAAWLNGKQLFDAKNIQTGETGFYEQQFGGPTWICPQQDQTQYQWGWVEWTK